MRMPESVPDPSDALTENGMALVGGVVMVGVPRLILPRPQALRRVPLASRSTPVSLEQYGGLMAARLVEVSRANPSPWNMMDLPLLLEFFFDLAIGSLEELTFGRTLPV